MAYSKTEEIVFTQGELISKNYGYSIYDVEFVKEGPHKFLRIYVWSEEGVDLDICEKISRELSEYLDREDLIPDAYFLEVSSPGIERVLKTDKHFLDATGEEIKVKLVKGQDKEVTGKLLSTDITTVVLLRDGEELKIERKNIAKANVVFKF
ncbi:MAG: ribosome maturation factor RimP [Clostridia bacterium]|nr:ribosome maturation factor RimP [Clostridia bacterium]MBQ6934957.1 ribosome maturation factor RimP [Clostridia bacterium]